jgi:hypothetical protein
MREGLFKSGKSGAFCAGKVIHRMAAKKAHLNFELKDAPKARRLRRS